MFVNNRNDFHFNLNNFIIPMLSVFFIMFIILSLIFTIIYFINKKFSDKLGFFNVIMIISYILFILLYIQGNFFTGNLPKLDGSVADWSQYGAENIITIVILLVLIIAYVICAFLAYFVIKAQFMTAIVVMVSGVLFAFFHKRKGSIIVIPVAALLFVFLFVAFSDTLIQITDENDMTAVSQRLEEIQHITARNAEEAQDFSYRQDLTRTSFETFLEHPLFGVHYKYESINEAKLLSIGNHAEWVDSLAKYGLFGILLIYFIIKVILKQKRLIDTNIHYLLFIVLVFFNPIFSFYMVFTVFAYLPLLRYVCFEE